MADTAGYKESPVLAAKVAAGELPPIDNACPTNRWSSAPSGTTYRP